ncbi:trehalose-phosphatase [Fundidesulfovibrio soli]|uniref:trehalose-phosphatase n=1 Tax=Fundidesulfovibrio soli TaxID=2922716 RepID=UPI001FAF4C06|nr:trehalose-phosphatase [Fundidesulfovibrio soli]
MKDTLPGLGQLLEDPLARQVLSGRRPWVLALDYDGTLAPFRPDRDHACPYAGVRDVLNRLPTKGRSRFVMISGRDASSLSRLLNIHPIPEIWGCHGAQRLIPGEGEAVIPLTPEQQAALEQARALVEDESRTETKPCGIAFHWRGLAPDEKREFMARLEPRLMELAGRAGFELHPFDGGLELRLPGASKATAIRSLLEEHPEALVIYLGDDRTDEDAFKALKGRGIGVLVSARPHASEASFWIRPPQELLALLGRFTSLNPKARRPEYAQ